MYSGNFYKMKGLIFSVFFEKIEFEIETELAHILASNAKLYANCFKV